MDRTEIARHAFLLNGMIRRMEDAEAENDKQLAAMIWDAIKYKKQTLAAQGIVIV